MVCAHRYSVAPKKRGHDRIVAEKTNHASKRSEKQAGAEKRVLEFPIYKEKGEEKFGIVTPRYAGNKTKCEGWEKGPTWFGYRLEV